MKYQINDHSNSSKTKQSITVDHFLHHFLEFILALHYIVPDKRVLE